MTLNFLFKLEKVVQTVRMVVVASDVEVNLDVSTMDGTFVQYWTRLNLKIAFGAVIFALSIYTGKAFIWMRLSASADNATSTLVRAKQ